MQIEQSRRSFWNGLFVRLNGLTNRTLPETNLYSWFTGKDRWAGYGNQDYEQSVPVAFAVERVKEIIGMAKPIVKELKGDQYVEVPRNHPLQRLMEYPSRKVTRFEFYGQTIANQALFGNNFYYLTGQAGGRPDQLQIIRPERVRIVPNTDMGGVAGYLYVVNGHHIPLSTDEVIHIKRWNPYNDYTGLPLTSSARADIEAHYHAGQWNANFFGENNAIPTLAVEVKGQINKQTFDQMIAQWKATGGMQRGTRFFQTGAGMPEVKIHDIGMNPIDESFANGRSANRKNVLDLFGVPESLFDKGATEASANVGQQLFYDIAWYKLQALAQVFTIELAPFFGALGDYLCEFEDIRPTNEQLKIQQIETAKQFFSINEIRERYYDEPTTVDWGFAPAAGAGSAIVQFMNGVSPMQTGRNVFGEGNTNPNNETTPNENTQIQPREDGNEGKALTIRECAVLAQKTALKQFKEGRWDPNLVPTAGIPRGSAELLRENLKLVTQEADILTAFDFLFAGQRHQKNVSEDNALLSKVSRLPQRWQDDLTTTANDIRDAFGFTERLKQLAEIPLEVETVLNTTEAEL